MRDTHARCEQYRVHVVQICANLSSRPEKWSDYFRSFQRVGSRVEKEGKKRTKKKIAIPSDVRFLFRLRVSPLRAGILIGMR